MRTTKLFRAGRVRITPSELTNNKTTFDARRSRTPLDVAQRQKEKLTQITGLLIH